MCVHVYVCVCMCENMQAGISVVDNVAHSIGLPAVQSLGLEGFFFLLWPFSVTCYLSLGLRRPSVLDTVKC